ncbi:MAG: protein translocase subunit SecD [Spirochaetaceae bacterium]
MTKRLRFLIILAVIIISGAFLYPTINWYFIIPEEDKELAESTRGQLRDYARGEARDTLADLQELATEDADAPLPEEYAYLEEVARESYRLEDRDVPDEWTAEAVLAAFPSEQEAFDSIEDYHRTRVQELKDMRSRIIMLGLDLSGGMDVVLEADEGSLADRLGEEPSSEEVDEAVDLAMEILSNRIDRFGITEPQISEMEGNRISVEIPGDTDRERVNSFLMGKGSLNFHIVDDEATEQLIELQQENPGWDPERDEVPDFVPAGSEVVEYVTRDQYGMDEFVRYIAIKSDVQEHGLPGQHITEAQFARDPVSNQPVVNFVLDSEGGDRFARLTRDNTGGSLAIVMDDRVRAYARIQEEIPTGQVRISGFDQSEAEDIATVLRTAALPIDLNIINQQSVGAQLGEQTIQAGLRAIAVGFLLVMVFMALYYKGSGLLADLVLILNLLFITGILSVFNLTLTLTSIAGIILTVGMAVDANVIIFERMKEEYRLGKSARAAVDAGFQKAFWTVTDANVTTFIAAVFLSQLGTGPIQGFAVTLAVGIVSSMFTALFVSRLIFDVITEQFGRAKLSIGWGVR